MAFTGKEETFLESSLSNIDFFPELSLGDFQRIHRVPAELAQEAVEHQLKLARNLVNDVLEEQRALWEADGHLSLEDMDTANGTDFKTYYLSAVFYRAKAELLQDFQTFSRRESSADMAKEGDSVHQALMADSDRCIRRLKGIRTSITVDLI
ncbi:head completion/stabilization protein [Pseudomaricurvus alkylphenolicus]|uniref:head completion/stabilization protein n=1 Tax=Pseudomaricurvus alkylphenolicus TaxID=1306991 RepID=UPI00141FDB35|nr:head completion/stabilization protein [Pseudomaricurvus alkylphenolicus]NIB44781.1 head completion/stabilization protein [Pseudomaricurvus alkylphenolicus]